MMGPKRKTPRDGKGARGGETLGPNIFWVGAVEPRRRQRERERERERERRKREIKREREKERNEAERE